MNKLYILTILLSVANLAFAITDEQARAQWNAAQKEYADAKTHANDAEAKTHHAAMQAKSNPTPANIEAVQRHANETEAAHARCVRATEKLEEIAAILGKHGHYLGKGHVTTTRLTPRPAN